MGFRHRLAESRLLRGAVTGGIAGWFRLCRRGAKWHVEGAAEVKALAGEGPVILILWHEHLLLAPVHWQQHIGTPIMSVHDSSRIGRLAGELQPKFGSKPMAMHARTSNLAMSRRVMQEARAGVSIGITADGPIGPRRVLQDAPVDWARFTGLPVVVYAFEMAWGRRLGTWDRLIWPMPLGRAACVYRVVSDRLARDSATGDHRDPLTSALNEVSARAAELVAGKA